MTRRFLMWTACIALAGCAAVPPNANELESARAAYRAAAADPQVQARAPVELEMAERALGDAERLHNAQVDPGRVAHFSYLAEQRARIAVKTAELRAAEAALATAGAPGGRLPQDLAPRNGASVGATR